MTRIGSTLIAIRRNLTDDLLQPKYRKRLKRKPTSGHCYVATEALYHILSLKEREKYKPYYLKVNDDTHWYLMTDDKIFILDPTYDQFDFLPDYDSGKRAGFLTKTPSKRTLILLQRIKNGTQLHTKNIRRSTPLS